jgi:two-component system, LuxR family, sensor kinase FixL
VVRSTTARTTMPGSPSSSLRRFATTATVYVVLYIALDWVSYIHPLGQLAITPWNPPPGLTIFLLLRHGLRYIPALFVAAIVADVVVRGASPEPMLLIAPPVLLASGYAALGALLVGPLGIGSRLTDLRDLNRFVWAAVVGPLAIAPAYAGLHVALGDLPPAEFFDALVQFWIGDAIGIVVTTPLLLEMAQRRIVLRARLDAEFLLQTGAVFLALWIVFGVKATDEFKFFYLLFVPLIWIAMRRGFRGAVVASFVIQIGIIAAAESIAAKGLLLRELQFLMLALALTALYLGMAVTEREAALRVIATRDAALNRSLRMATAGELAAAVAHELNQPLAAIANYVRACILLQDRRESVPQLRETLGKVGREVERAGAVIRRLREFYRTGSARRERIGPRALIDAAAESLRPRLAQSHVEIAISCAPGLPPVEVDTIQIEAVLHNLVGNAVDALAATDIAQRRIRIAAVAGSGGTLVVEIADNGPGISAEVASHLFEPFTSTKPDGMGLGLAMSRSIVEAHGGRLGLRPDADWGTTFELILPFANSDEHEHST